MMKRLLLIIICCVVFPGAFVVANAQTKLPQVKFRERTLANGLRVLNVMDKSSRIEGRSRSPQRLRASV